MVVSVFLILLFLERQSIERATSVGRLNICSWKVILCCSKQQQNKLTAGFFVINNFANTVLWKKNNINEASWRKSVGKKRRVKTNINFKYQIKCCNQCQSRTVIIVFFTSSFLVTYLFLQFYADRSAMAVIGVVYLIFVWWISKKSSQTLF